MIHKPLHIAATCVLAGVRVSLLVFVALAAAQENAAAADALTTTKSTGPVMVKTTLVPSKPTIGDEVTLTIEVAAEKNVEVLMPEFAEALDRYTIVDFVPRQRVETDGSMIHSQKYTLQPFISGEQSIPPILVEFIDNRPGRQPVPDDFDAYEILTDRIDFTVQSVVADDASGELKPPLGTLELSSSGKSSWGWLVLLGILAVAAMVAGGLYCSRARRRARRINAFEIAHRRLTRLLEDRESDAPKLSVEAFFVEISDIVRHYLEDRFELRAPELTTDEFMQLAAAESELSREHQNLLSEFLKQADIVKFAGVQASEADIGRSSDLAMRFIEETRENAPDIEVDELQSDLSPPKPNAARVTTDA